MKKKLLVSVLMILVISMLLNACGTSETEATEAAVEETAASEVAVDATEASAEDTVADAAADDATFVMAALSEPDTLDPHLTSMAISDQIMFYFGASLVWMTPDLTYEPYLAESWTNSEDGLIWEFKLRQDVKFSDGTPFTANDYAFTFNRALDPETASPGAGPMLGFVTSVEAVDDYTLRITLSDPNAPILYGLADPGYMQPINQALFEEIGADNYGRSPVSVGPFVFKEWSIGEKIVLERNPDYNWGPASMQNQGAYKFQTLVFQIIPEYSTVLAGLESGDVDSAQILAQDVDRLESNEAFQILSGLQQGISPYVTLNTSVAPFDDVRVRQAFNLAVDKQALINVILQGAGVVQNGYLSSTMMGYWPGVEEIGYGYDLEQAKALMQEAGYTMNTDGIWEKDGQALSLTLYTTSADQAVKVAQVLQEQYTALGVQIEISQMESNVLYPQLMAGDYQISIAGLTYGEADLMYMGFHSSQIGTGLNLSYVNDPELDTLLEQSRAEGNVEARQEILNQLQQKIVEEAYVIPLYSPKLFVAVTNGWQGIDYLESMMILDISGAYLPE